MSPPPPTHPQHEDFPWTIAVVDHPKRTESALYRRSRTLMHSIVDTLGQGWTFAPGPYEDHHGGGLWVLDATGWLCLQTGLGIEWSAQFCADPAKVEGTRQLAIRVLAAFPTTLAGYEALGYHDGVRILGHAIVTPADVSEWTDSIFNASVPLPFGTHSGVLPRGAGYHHYPKPIVDIDHFRFDDFQLFVTDDQGLSAAVVPVAPRGSGDGRVRLLAAHTASRYISRLQEMTPTGEPSGAADAAAGGADEEAPDDAGLAAGAEDPDVLPDDDPLAVQAFAGQHP
jgi:hypothetical protein